jgi:hypothetical protein
MGTVRPMDLYPKILKSHEVEKIKGASQQREGLPQQEEFAKRLEESAKEKVKRAQEADRSEIPSIRRDSRGKGMGRDGGEKKKDEEEGGVGKRIDIKV